MLIEEEGRKMNIQQLKYVYSIYETGSIHGVAQQLYLTASTISTAVKDLENELNIQIFTRSQKGMIPTKEGIEFIDRIKHVLSQLEELEEVYVNGQSMVKKERVSISSEYVDLASEAFSRLIVQANPMEYEYRFMEMGTKNVIEDVIQNNSQIGLLCKRKSTSRVIERILKKENLTFFPLYQFKPHVVVRKGHPLSLQSTVSVDDLSSYPFVELEYTDPIFSNHELRSGNIYSGGRIVVGDRSSLIGVLSHSDGFFIGPSLIGHSLIENNLVTVPVILMDKFALGYICKSNSTLLPEMYSFIRILKEVIRERTSLRSVSSIIVSC